MDIEYIKKVLKDKKITYEELAKMTNLSISAIKKIFSGVAKYPRIDTVEAIEKALGLEKEKSPSTLNDDEQRLLSAYRQLADSRKKYILELIEDLGATKENEQKKFRI